MLWLGLYLPRLALEAFERGTLAGPSPSGPPSADGSDPGAVPALAICDRTHVCAANAAAQARGVQPGIRRATALALVPDLILRTRDRQRERETLEELACWALQFTPSVSLQEEAAATTASRSAPGDSPCALLLEIEPSLRLFGGRDALLGRIRAGVGTLGFTVQTGCAPTPGAAALLARHGDGLVCDDPAQLRARLARLPVDLLGSARPQRAALEAVGVHTIDALLRLPRAGVARRFGKEVLLELDRALGALPEPRAWFAPPLTFRARLELLGTIDNAAALLFAANRLLLQLCGWLAARQGAVRSFELWCEHEEAPVTVVTVALADPCRDVQRLSVLLRERLGVTRLRGPVRAVELHGAEVLDFAPVSRDLFPAPAVAAEDLARLIERLQARLGNERVRHFSLADEHRPERAYRSAALVGPPRLAASIPQHAMHPATSIDPSELCRVPGLPRPVWLLAQPLALGERGQRPCWGSPLALLAGPERIEAGWWDRDSVQRDYFIAEDDAHRLLWIFRERLPDPDGRQGWFLHGLFG